MEKEKVRNMLTFLYNYYLENTDQMDDEFIRLIKNGEHKDTVVCDYIACMTDRFSITAFKRLFYTNLMEYLLTAEGIFNNIRAKLGVPFGKVYKH